jgi:NAD-dependent deacetylase
MKKIIVFTGAGISAESGISTFRDANGLWENHDIYEVATPEGWKKNPALVLRFYNARRNQLLTVQPNAAHHALARLEEKYEVHIVTQNVDDLHERAGSTRIVHLHGELLKARSSVDPGWVVPCTGDIALGELCAHGQQLRPHIVWFGEGVPLMDAAVELASQADIFMVVGTSLQVYPAANLLQFVPRAAQQFYVDPQPAKMPETRRMRVVSEPATVGVVQLVSELLGETDGARPS